MATPPAVSALQSAWTSVWTRVEAMLEAETFTRAAWVDLMQASAVLAARGPGGAEKVLAAETLGWSMGYLPAPEARPEPPTLLTINGVLYRRTEKLYSPEQERDEAGRWTAGGGGGTDNPGGTRGGARGGGAGPRAAEHSHAAGGGPRSLDERPNGSKRVWTDKLPEGMHKESWQGYYKESPWSGGKVTDPERAILHENIIHEAMGNVKPSPPGERVAIMTMGAPASGKSTMLAGTDTSKFVVADPDAIKGHLPEYQKAIEDRGNTYRGAAAMVHEESSDIAKQVIERAVSQGKNLIIDGTGANAKSFSDKIDMLHAAGYNVHVAMPHLDEETGMKRLIDRADRSGRLVPLEFARQAYGTIPRNFETLAKKADSFALYDATRSSGGGIEKVWSKDRGGEEVHDPAFVDAFKAKFSVRG